MVFHLFRFQIPSLETNRVLCRIWESSQDQSVWFLWTDNFLILINGSHSVSSKQAISVLISGWFSYVMLMSGLDYTHHSTRASHHHPMLCCSEVSVHRLRQWQTVSGSSQEAADQILQVVGTGLELKVWLAINQWINIFFILQWLQLRRSLYLFGHVQTWELWENHHWRWKGSEKPTHP